MVVRKKTTAAPAKKAAPARPVAKKAASATAPKPAAPKKPVTPKVTAHDVLRAQVAAKKAQELAEELERQYWAQDDADLDGAVEAAAAITEGMAPPKRSGRKPADTPSAKARASQPVAGEYYDLDKVSAMGIKEVRELAQDLAAKGLITETKLKREIIAQMTAAGLFRAAGSGSTDADDAVDDDETLPEDSEEEYEEDDSEDDDESEDSDDDDEDESDEDDDDEDEDDEDGYSLDDLKAMKLKELQDLAEQNDLDVEDMSKAEIVEALWELATGGDDEDEEDDEEPEDDDSDDEDESEEEEDDDDEEVIEIDPAELKKMAVDEVYDLAKKIGVKVPVAKRKDKKFLITKIEEFLTEDDEDEDE